MVRIEAPALWRKPPATATPLDLKLPRLPSTLPKVNGAEKAKFEPEKVLSDA